MHSGLQVSVDVFPGCLRRAGELFGAIAVHQLLVIGQTREDETLQCLTLFPRDLLFVLRPGFVGVRFKPLLALVGRQAGIDLCRRDSLRFAPPQALVVHGEDFQKDLSVFLGIIGGREEQTENRCPHQDERLAAPPLAKAGQGLARTRFPFLVTFLRELRDWKLRFDK